MKYAFWSLLMVLYATFLAQAQNLDQYKWSEAKYLSQDAKYAEKDQVYILRIQHSELNFRDSRQSFDQISMNHYVVQINTEIGLKMRKELEYPSVSENKQVLEFKARVIHPDGTFYEFKKSDLKEKKESQRERFNEDDEDDEYDDEDDKGDEDEDEDEDDDTYTYFDLSNLKIGSQLEFFMLIEIKAPSMTGSLLNYQSRIPVQEFSFELNATKEFSFVFKGYNGAPQVVQDSTNKTRSIYRMTDSMIDDFPKEKFSNFGANIRGVIYKLDGYELGKKKDFFNTDDFSRNLYDYMYRLDKKEKSVMKKVMKLSKVKSFKSDEEKILALENYIKTNFSNYNFSGLNFLFTIENLYVYDAITGENSARLMANILKELSIEHEIVLTCNRFDYRFDKDFQTNFFMDKFMLFFPNQKKFLDPNTQGMRLGMIPGVYTHNNALFIRTITAGGITSGIGKIKFIDAKSKSDSKDRIEVRVSFEEDLSATNFDLTRTMTGYFAADWQPFFRKIDAEQRVRYEKSLIRFMDENLDLTKSEYLNIEKSDINKNPFVVKGNGKSKALLSSQSDTLIFKVGKLIGEQANLYDAESRALPIERASARTYERVLTIELPKDYSIQNLDELNLNFEMKNEAGQLAGLFKSSYELKNNVLVVTIEEWFQDIVLPASKYQAFRDIINASADFYKLELLMTR